jgi:hypothetical protein
VIGGYAIIVVGCVGVWLALTAIRDARRDGYYQFGTGKWISPTDLVTIRKFVVAKRAMAIGAGLIIAIGIWVVLSPQTLLSLLPP